MTLCPSLESVIWTKSSFSDGGNNCVMVGRADANFVGVRDSKAPELPPLIFSAAAWSEFLDTVKAKTTDGEIIASAQDADVYDLDLSGVTWRGATGTDPANRVETAQLPAGAIALRHPAVESILRYTRAEWVAFTRGVRASEFDVPAAA